MSSSLDNAARAARADEWFAEAQKQVRAAKRLLGQRDLEPLAIFHLEQALEMSVKGLARASGYSHDKLKRGFGHNYVDLYISLLEDVLDGSDLLVLVNGILSSFYAEGTSYDASSHLSNVRDHLASPKSARAKLTDADWGTIYLTAFRVSVDEVDRLIHEYDSVSRERAISFGALVVLREQIALECGVPVSAVSPSDVNKDFEARFPSLRALIGLLVFGCIFWPHNMPTRYPASPDADGDVFQVGQFGLMGVRHYSSDLGVVKRLKVLSECCEEVIEALIEGHSRGHLFMTREDVSLGS